MKSFSSHDFPDLYKRLDINVPGLGCVMLDVKPEFFRGDPYRDRLESGDVLYKSDKPERFWIDGYVAGQHPHITLLYGLLTPAYEQPDNIAEVLADWSLDTVQINSIGFFDSPYKDDPYYCIVAHVKVSPELQEGHDRLELLPHVNTFPGYKAHITLAYVQRDENVRDDAITNFESWLVGREVPLMRKPNLGSNKG